MKRPIYIREDTWKFLQDAIQKFSYISLIDKASNAGYTNMGKTYNEVIQQIIDQPAPFLLMVGILDEPELLQRTVISMSDDVEYVINLEAAIALKKKDHLIKLLRLDDNKVFIVTYENVLKSLKDHSATFDQLDFTKKYPREFLN